jgi:indolepyruvate ferredoxin oxidoreductase
VTATFTERETSRRDYRLEDRYAASASPVFLSGVQAVCRIPLDGRRVDHLRGLNTRAFLSGYQGSPLGTVDFAVRPMLPLFDELGVDFRPGMNESLAATAVQGTQSVTALGSPLQGVTGYWYGKAPGVDQALDAIRHGNLMGTHPLGGVLAFAGDDATAKSSTVPCGSEGVLRSAFIPVLAPADQQDVLDLGLHGVALSRATGLWAGMKVSTNVADGAGVVTVDLPAFDPVIPERYQHQVRTTPVAALAVAMEQNLHEVRLPLALAYARENGLNTITVRGPADRLGLVAAGYPYLELRQALADMGLDDAALRRLGIRVLKVGMPWPLEPSVVRDFADDLEEVLVVEDKGPFLETLIKDQLCNLATRPIVVGTRDEHDRPLLPRFGGIDADTLARAMAPRILARGDVPSVRARLDALTAPRRATLPLSVVKRTPYFCSGCPHNSSTKTPDGALTGGGIGCHGMVILMDDEQSGHVTGLTQMGGEGAQWNGQAAYAGTDHLFQNLGDGTLAHSGLLAIRSSVAAGVNITYKILYNAAVAMTGGQDGVGGYTVPQLCRTLAAEGVRRVVVTTDHPEHYRGVKLPSIADVRHRDQLQAAQEELQGMPGVTVLLHDQPCAAEQRRKRKRGLAPDPAARVIINERICEGCGDCGRKSNCLSVVPVQTELGRKTQIEQSSCNKDYSCLDGDCPSFMTVIPDPAGTGTSRPAPIAASELAAPTQLLSADGFSVRITGIGGTGVVTLAQILATAGFLDGLAPRVLDQVGLSQKAGPVVSDLKFAAANERLSPRLNAASCSLYLGCDILVAGDRDNLTAADPLRTVAVVSTADVPSGVMVRHPETAFPAQQPTVDAIDARTRREHNAYVDAKRIADRLLGGEQLANMVLAGAAFQAGALPLSEQSIERAIALNGVAVEANIQAFRRGRQAVADPVGLEVLLSGAGGVTPESPLPDRARDLIASVGAEPGGALDASLTLRVPDLVEYQNEHYARRYVDVVAKVRAAEAALGSTALTEAVASNLHKLMAYKDEYEVARLALDKTERAKIRALFGPKAKVAWKLHPPALRALGMRRKLSLGRWFTAVFVLLSWLKPLRGTPFDPFGYARVRRVERALVDEYVEVVGELVAGLTPLNLELAVRIAELPDLVRGYEHVKLANVEVYREQLAELREAYATPAVTA